MYCKSGTVNQANYELYHLIETFCIVNFAFASLQFLKCSDLIETFCIVNKYTLIDKTQVKMNLIETFCIVNFQREVIRAISDKI